MTLESRKKYGWEDYRLRNTGDNLENTGKGCAPKAISSSPVLS